MSDTDVDEDLDALISQEEQIRQEERHRDVEEEAVGSARKKPRSSAAPGYASPTGPPDEPTQGAGAETLDAGLACLGEHEREIARDLVSEQVEFAEGLGGGLDLVLGKAVAASDVERRQIGGTAENAAAGEDEEGGEKREGAHNAKGAGGRIRYARPAEAPAGRKGTREGV